jgi:hypothetical protein
VGRFRSALETIRALGFGGLFTAGIGTFIYYRYLITNPTIDPRLFIGASAGVGLAIQELIGRAIDISFGPIFRLIKFRRKLDELRELRRTKELTQAAYDDLVKKVCEKRFLEK